MVEGWDVQWVMSGPSGTDVPGLIEAELAAIAVHHQPPLPALMTEVAERVKARLDSSARDEEADGFWCVLVGTRYSSAVAFREEGLVVGTLSAKDADAPFHLTAFLGCQRFLPTEVAERVKRGAQKFSKHKLKEWKEWFERIDKDNSGTISIDELQEEFNLDQGSAEEIFASMDIHLPNGRISIDEFNAWMAINEPDPEFEEVEVSSEDADRFRSFFEILDANGDGMVSVGELEAVGVTPEQTESLMTAHELSRFDNMFDLQEFAVWMRRGGEDALSEAMGG